MNNTPSFHIIQTYVRYCKEEIAKHTKKEA